MTYNNSNLATDIDISQMIQQFNNDQTLAKKIIRICLNDLPVYMTELNAAIEQQDIDTVKLICHSLKNKSNYFNQSKLTNVLIDIEKTASAQEQLKKVQQNHNDLEQAVKNLIDQLSSIEKRLPSNEY